MKLRTINEQARWTYWVPDSIADWDAPSHWERERLASMEQHLAKGDVLFDVGTEHGWLSAVYGGFVGYENVVLFEPSSEFWPNIRMIWEHNSFEGPMMGVCAFVGETSTPGFELPDGLWPLESVGEECGAMAYRRIDTHDTIPTISIDDYVKMTEIVPAAITMDIEGAEIFAVRGARHTLAIHRPLVWVSIHPDLIQRDFKGTKNDVLREFAAQQYRAEFIGHDHEEHWLFIPRERA